MMNRRDFSKILPGAALAAPSLFGAQRRRPNIVMIYADDLGFGDLGCYGHPTIKTPNIDRLAGEGLRFSQFYSAAPVCTPSRAALLTGRLPMRSGLTRVLFPQSEGGIPESEVTVAEGLSQAGYRTACVGKWHLGWQAKYLPTNHGFGSYFGIPYSNDMTPMSGPGAPGNARYPALPLYKDLEVVDREPDQSRLTERYTAECVSFLKQKSDKPFYLYYPQTFPHVPLYASKRFEGKSARGLYGDVVEEIDWSVGEILRAIKETGKERETLVVFSSDNGPWLIKDQLGGSAGLLREGKGTTWEGGMREPCIARWPGVVAPGGWTQAVSTTMDLFTTFMKLGGGKMPEDRTIDGEDLTPVLQGTSQGWARTMFYWHHEDLCAVRKGEWKLHVRYSNQVDQPRGSHAVTVPMLFHLGHDPSEKYDVAAANPDVVKDLSTEIERHKREMKPGVFQR